MGYRTTRFMVVYVIQKSNKYGLKQYKTDNPFTELVVYVIQKSNKYGLKQWISLSDQRRRGCVCHSKK